MSMSTGNTSKSDELRARLPHLASEMYQAIELALARAADAAQRNITASFEAGANGNAITAQRAAGYAKCLEDFSIILRPARDAQQQFARWLGEVLDQEVDHCGLTAQEREELVRTHL